MIKDIRFGQDGSNLASEFFWDSVSKAQEDPSIFAKMTDDQLISFAQTMHDLKGHANHLPFRPGPDVLQTPDTLYDAFVWVVSQGKKFFLKVWNQPELFHEIYEKDVWEEGFEFEVPVYVEWDRRHPNEEMPMHRFERPNDTRSHFQDRELKSQRPSCFVGPCSSTLEVSSPILW